jgi:CBS domain-containing protein
VAQKVQLDSPLSGVMTKDIVTISVGESFDNVKVLLRSRRIRHLPVTDKTGKLVGLISIRAFNDEVMEMETHHAKS